MVTHPDSADSYAERGQAFWLPPGGFGNGLPAAAWAQAAVLAASQLRPVLAALTEARIPAHVDVARGAKGFRDVSGSAGYLLWVDSHRYSAATDLLMDLLRRPLAGRIRRRHRPGTPDRNRTTADGNARR